MHDEHVSKTIEMVQTQIRGLEQQLAEKKRMVNSLCGLIGQSPVYPADEPAAGLSLQVRSDEFYGKPLATVVKSILLKRGAANLGATSVSEIYDVMVKGGFRFDAKNDGTAKRSLAISLAKNTATFHRLPNGDFGLTEWYPNAVTQKNGSSNGDKDGLKTPPKDDQAKGDEEEESDVPPPDFRSGFEEDAAEDITEERRVRPKK